MSQRWSNEAKSIDYKELQSSSMAIDSIGKYIVLSGRRFVSLIDLDKPENVIKNISRSSKWEVSVSEWSPRQTSMFALASNVTTEIYLWNEIFDKNIDSLNDISNYNWNPHILLKGHTRSITDLNWSPFDGNMLATSSIDTYALIWDLRDYRRPFLSLSSVAAASQVKWSKADENLLATSHEVDIRIWDKRKGNTPLYYIAAHLFKIFGLDWNPLVGSQFMTCSQDCTVKFWDLSVLKNKAEMILSSTLPVWRARYTPFGKGILTVVIPKIRSKGENTLWLWNINELQEPVHSFLGSTDIVLDFGWRFQKDNHLELITWSKDFKLRVWSIDQQIISLIDEDIAKDLDLDLSMKNFTINNVESESEESNIVDMGSKNDSTKNTNSSQSDSVKKFKNRSLAKHFDGRNTKSFEFKNLNNKQSLQATSAPSSMMTSPRSRFDTTNSPTNEIRSADIAADLEQEFSLINLNIPNLKLEELNPSQRYCVFGAISNSINLRLKIVFPTTYPNDVLPVFTFIEHSYSLQSSAHIENESTVNANRLTQEMRNKLLKALQNTAHIQVKRNRPCVEPCMRDFMITFDKLTSPNSLTPTLTTPTAPTDYSLLYGSFQDAHVPFPKTCGATFCSADLLICFGRPPHLQRMNVPTEFTPRALSALSAVIQVTSAAQGGGNTVVTNASLNGSATDITDFNSLNQIPQGISSFYYNNRQKKKRSFKKNSSNAMHKRINFLTSPQHHANANNNNSSNSKCGPVYIYSLANILPCNRKLAQEYVFRNNPVDMCRENAEIATLNNRKDLSQTWALAGLCSNPILFSIQSCVNSNMIMDAPWAVLPTGRKLAQSLIDYYLKTCCDIQTAALLCCIFTGRCNICGRTTCFPKRCNKTHINSTSSASSSPVNSPYHTIHGSSSITSPTIQVNAYEEWSLVSALETIKRTRSNSWSDSFENYLYCASTNPSSPSTQNPGFAYRIHCNEMALLRDQREAEKHDLNMKLIDQKLTFQYDCLKQIYADLLLRWGLLHQRAQLMKYVSVTNNYQIDFENKRIGFSSKCLKCKKDFQGPQCTSCKEISMRCIVCRRIVKGATTFCTKCGHGGHTLHIYDWFVKMDQCPTGCGCQCLEI